LDIPVKTDEKTVVETGVATNCGTKIVVLSFTYETSVWITWQEASQPLDVSADFSLDEQQEWTSPIYFPKKHPGQCKLVTIPKTKTVVAAKVSIIFFSRLFILQAKVHYFFQCRKIEIKLLNFGYTLVSHCFIRSSGKTCFGYAESRESPINSIELVLYFSQLVLSLCENVIY